MNKRIIGGVLVVIVAALSVILGTDLFKQIDLPNDGMGDNTGDDGGDIVLPPVDENNPDWYEIYFTNPTCPPESERVGGLDEIIAADISQSQLQVDVAGFDIDAGPIVNALIDRDAAGLAVRVVTDADNADTVSIRRLRRNGVSVVEDRRTGLMHNKFIVIDGRYVWMGSLNYTTNGVYCNNNNLARLASSRLAANYTVEMDEMYNDRLFGPDSPPKHAQ